MPKSTPSYATTIGQPATGYRGIWYQNSTLPNRYRFKYSGGLGTYCAKHQPFAVYRPEVHQTFFCYGGAMPDTHTRLDLTAQDACTVAAEGALQHMVGVYDHATGRVSRPTWLLDKQTLDAHDNPVISVDHDGYIWVFSTAHGQLRPAYVHRSTAPYDIASFERVEPTLTMTGGENRPIDNFSYMQAWQTKPEGFAFFYTQYTEWNRHTCFARSADGATWTGWTELARFGLGHYQISAVREGLAATAFDYHPEPVGLNARTNLYYLQTRDLGRTWQTVTGEPITPPLTDPKNPALVHDYAADGLLVYIKDIDFDDQGRPHILYLTASSHISGPEGGQRTWRLARWTGQRWTRTTITHSDSNYDMGSLYLEPGGRMHLIAPTETGPQAYNPGGEVAVWVTDGPDQPWRLEQQLTHASTHNHTFVRRPVDAHDDFYAFWADGDGRAPSASRFYFATRQGRVFRLPTEMDSDWQAPIPLAPITQEALDREPRDSRCTV